MPKRFEFPNITYEQAKRVIKYVETQGYQKGERYHLTSNVSNVMGLAIKVGISMPTNKARELGRERQPWITQLYHHAQRICEQEKNPRERERRKRDLYFAEKRVLEEHQKEELLIELADSLEIPRTQIPNELGDYFKI